MFEKAFIEGIMGRMVKARYIGRNPKLRGATAIVNLATGEFQLDRYPGAPRADLCDSKQYPLLFGWHKMAEGEWHLEPNAIGLKEVAKCIVKRNEKITLHGGPASGMTYELGEAAARPGMIIQVRIQEPVFVHRMIGSDPFGAIVPQVRTAEYEVVADGHAILIGEGTF